jgi:fumarate reductase subunit D
MWSFIIIVVISFLSIIFNLTTKTNLLVSSHNDPTYYNLDRSSVKHNMDIIMTIIFAIICLITILIFGLTIIFDYISNIQNIGTENEGFIQSENQFLLLLTITIISLFQLTYLFYNLISRNKNVISLSATFIRYSEQYVKKV